MASFTAHWQHYYRRPKRLRVDRPSCPMLVRVAMADEEVRLQNENGGAARLVIFTGLSRAGSDIVSKAIGEHPW